ncbi:SH3-domain-containing protein [Dendrothele bispora CBS 962.96]|uniref:SH3-domain-containing protein n=1 Tax=Dendrothele bispora (strain CBS 962.96) TaxID=1314807 RepID=A0A4S8MKR7_DENBC|nr:SH3-domain-containing protein [Dendrothele bispora CBS 962.96]
MGYIDGQAFLDHLIAQTRQNVDFLVAQKQISPEAAREILARLPSPPSAPIALDPVSALTTQTQNLSVAVPEPRSFDAPPSAPAAVRAKALWDYNVDGTDPNDLSFRAGDIVEVTHETNPDWWTGRHNGREGLFPSNYVEKLPPSALPPKPPSRSPGAHPPPPPSSHAYTPPPPAPYVPSYQPPPGPPMGYQPSGGPPPPSAYNPYMNPPAPGPPPPPQPVQTPPEKPPSRWGNLGNTMATSAAGGVGFGAGSAVGSGIINSIF